MRTNWNTTMMEIAELIARNRSTCANIKVGCVISKDNRIVSIGYNGVPSGFKHCSEIWDNSLEHFKSKHSEWSNINEIHAEMNAILFAAKNGINLNGTKLYTTYSPCVNCAKNIQAVGVTHVCYKYDYKSNDGINILKNRNIPCEKINY